MAAPNGTLALPNSLTPLAFLPPDLAHEVQTATFIQVGTLGVRMHFPVLCLLLFLRATPYRCFSGIF